MEWQRPRRGQSEESHDGRPHLSTTKKRGMDTMAKASSTMDHSTKSVMTAPQSRSAASAATPSVMSAAAYAGG